MTADKVTPQTRIIAEAIESGIEETATSLQLANMSSRVEYQPWSRSLVARVTMTVLEAHTKPIDISARRGPPR